MTNGESFIRGWDVAPTRREKIDRRGSSFYACRLALPPMILATVCKEVASGLLASLFDWGFRYCGGLGIPPGPAGSIALASCACAWIERLTTTPYSLAKRLVSSAVRIAESGLDDSGKPNGVQVSPDQKTL